MNVKSQKVAFTALSSHTTSAKDPWGWEVGFGFVAHVHAHTSLCIRATGRNAMVSLWMTEDAVESVLFSPFLLSWGGIELRSSGCTASVFTY